jgi:cation transport regulator ChaB
MPYYSDDEVPSTVPKSKRKMWREVWNAAYKEYKDEGRAFATAWAAIKKSIDDEMVDLIGEIEDTRTSKLIKSIEARFKFTI